MIEIEIGVEIDQIQGTIEEDQDQVLGIVREEDKDVIIVEKQVIYLQIVGN